LLYKVCVPSMEKTSKISYIIPVYNEEENLPPLLDDLKEVAEKVAVPFEIIFIDDASTDDSLNIIKSMETDYETLRYALLPVIYTYHFPLPSGCHEGEQRVKAGIQGYESLQE